MRSLTMEWLPFLKVIRDKRHNLARAFTLLGVNDFLVQFRRRQPLYSPTLDIDIFSVVP